MTFASDKTQRGYLMLSSQMKTTSTAIISYIYDERFFEI
jgi:hypothetical protein